MGRVSLFIKPLKLQRYRVQQRLDGTELNGNTGLNITAFTGFEYDAKLIIPAEVSNIYIETQDATTLSGSHT